MYHLVFNFRYIMEELAFKSEKKNVDVANTNILTNSGQIMVFFLSPPLIAHLHRTKVSTNCYTRLPPFLGL